MDERTMQRILDQVRDIFYNLAQKYSANLVVELLDTVIEDLQILRQGFANDARREEESQP